MSRKKGVKFRKSVFTRLLLVILFAGICINFLMGMFFHFFFQEMVETAFKRNIIQYVTYLIDDLGIPPDKTRATAISKTASLNIRFEGPNASWSTSPNMMNDRRIRFHIWHESPGIKIGKHRGHYFVFVEKDAGRFVFELARTSAFESKIHKIILILLALFTLILVGAYFKIRKILKPVTWLENGVEKVSGGDLSHKVPVKNDDELGRLANAFNTMTGRVGHMLHARKQLLLDVSHELRSPITRIKVALEFLDDSKAKKTIQEDVKELEQMVTLILETARERNMAEQLKLETVSFQDLVNDLLPEFEKRKPRIRISKRWEPVTIRADREKIKTVIKNILDNAVKYSGPESDPVTLSIEKQGDQAVFTIKDHGRGIPEDELSHLFEPFYRVDKSRTRKTGGYGLGLAICKTIMDAHKAKIQIQSVPDKGTIVKLYFPKTYTTEKNEDLK